MPGEHDEQLLALVALADDGLAVLVVAHVRDLQHAQDLAVVERAEERHARQDVALELQLLGARFVARGHVADGDDDGGDVVLAAALVGSVDQRLAGRIRVRIAEAPAEALQIVLEVAAQAVRAEQEAIARGQIEDQRVGLDVLVHADRARDGVLLRELLDLLARHLLALDELVVDRVIFGELLEQAVAQHVDAAVTDVDDERLRADHEQADQGRAHAALLGVLDGFGVHPLRGAIHGELEHVQDVALRDLGRALGGAA